MRFYSINQLPVRTRVEGGKKSQNFAYILYGRPHTTQIINCAAVSAKSCSKVSVTVFRVIFSGGTLSVNKIKKNKIQLKKYVNIVYIGT